MEYMEWKESGRFIPLEENHKNMVWNNLALGQQCERVQTVYVSQQLKLIFSTSQLRYLWTLVDLKTSYKVTCVARINPVQIVSSPREQWSRWELITKLITLQHNDPAFQKYKTLWPPGDSLPYEQPEREKSQRKLQRPTQDRTGDSSQVKLSLHHC